MQTETKYDEKAVQFMRRNGLLLRLSRRDQGCPPWATDSRKAPEYQRGMTGDVCGY